MTLFPCLLKGEHAEDAGVFWRLSRKEFESQKGDTNKLAMKTIVAAGEVPGILVYHNSEAIGWCALIQEQVP